MRGNKRNILNGYSRSELKTLLKSLGFKVSKTFFRDACVAEHKHRKYRFRYWGDWHTNSNAFFVDVGERNATFDRWANSTERTIYFKDFLIQFGVNKKHEKEN